MDADWPASVEEERRWREALYLGPETPLAADARGRFKGLRWFPVEARWRIEGIRLARHATRRPGGLPATGADAVALDEVGVLEVPFPQGPARLLAYQPAPGEAEEDYVLIPFRDATSGRETYGGGRYLDVEPRADGVYTIDFNRAYHPYCAFDDAWACVLPPPENRVPFPIHAGERL